MVHGGLAQVWRSGAADQLTTIRNFSVTELAFGRNHCIFLTSSGHVFGYGAGDVGQLGKSSFVKFIREAVDVSSTCIIA